ncbi:MAG: NAD(P)H oxidoreductase [Gammaproteobacteria bacterium]|nr:NAD(P)H oxidoreductase [Gammaproteobacteria bacterium]MCP5092952.1 NAD(P)H oxidoreductase [Gammaproteobacteria bacterium]
MNVLVVICHPRRQSLTWAVAEAFIEGLRQSGHGVEIADLHAENFDPRMPIADEPDYGDPEKMYSEEVRSEMARIERSDAIAMFFPVWWWSVPAMLKGWIDRVWNFGWAYGWAEFEAHIPLSRAQLVALGGSSLKDFEDGGYDKLLDTQLRGLTEYSGIADTRFELFTDTLDKNARFDLMLARARELGRQFDA